MTSANASQPAPQHPSTWQPNSWQPTATLAALGARAEILWSIRSFFRAEGMQEVQTPILSRDTVLDRHIDPVVLPGAALGLGELHDTAFYLQTSPEFGMKRLLAAGMQAFYQIGPVFRAGERGDFHNPEFSMVEWYRAGDGLEQAVDLLARVVCHALSCPAPEAETYQQVFLRLTQHDPLTCSVSDLAELAVANNLGVERHWSHDRDDWLNLLFSELIQPQLGHAAPAIITHYPASQSALARLSEQDDRTAERFELFINGVELANGYHELLDASELLRRNASVAGQRQTDGKAPLPTHSRLIDAMQTGLPACSGCALGLDRLVMIATGATSIAAVIPFPIERA